MERQSNRMFSRNLVKIGHRAAVALACWLGGLGIGEGMGVYWGDFWGGDSSLRSE